VVEPGIWPLVQAANESGYPTIASCEGHTDDRYAYVTFRASNDDALRIHLRVRAHWDELRCNWELLGRFLCPAGTWELIWSLENHGLKAPNSDTDYAAADTAAAQQDVPRLAELFRSLAKQ
jgi:hypothetical protein